MASIHLSQSPNHQTNQLEVAKTLAHPTAQLMPSKYQPVIKWWNVFCTIDVFVCWCFPVFGEYSWIFCLHLLVTLMNYSQSIFRRTLLNKRFDIGDSQGAYDTTARKWNKHPAWLNRLEFLVLDCLFHEAMASRLRWWPAMHTALWWASMPLGDWMLGILFRKFVVPKQFRLVVFSH